MLLVLAVAVPTWLLYSAALLRFASDFERVTWLGLLNFAAIQWACVRLARISDADGRTVGWRLLRWVWPLTGWWSDYKGSPR